MTPVTPVATPARAGANQVPEVPTSLLATSASAPPPSQEVQHVDNPSPTGPEPKVDAEAPQAVEPAASEIPRKAGRVT